MISLTEFMWLLHFCAMALYIWEIVRFIRYRRKYSDIIEGLKKEKFPYWQNALGSQLVQSSLPWLVLHWFFFGIAVDAIPITLMIFSFAAVWMAAVSEVFDRIEQNSQKKEEEPAPKTKQEQFAGSDSEAGYGFDPNQFGDFKERKEAPRGFEDRHPDDAKIWAVIDDPNAPPNVRRTAFDKILQRQEKRQRQEKNSNSSNPKRIPVKG